MFEKMSQGLYKILKVVVIDIKLNSPENASDTGPTTSFGACTTTHQKNIYLPGQIIYVAAHSVLND